MKSRITPRISEIVLNYVPDILLKVFSFALVYLRCKNVNTWGSIVAPGAIINKSNLVRKNTIVGQNSSIGVYTYIGRYCNLNYIDIGKYCILGEGIKTYSFNHNFLLPSLYPFFDYSISPIKYKVNKYRKMETVFKGKIKIGNDVWIGDDVKLMGGITIGDGAVIAAGSIVTKDIAPYTIAGGIPAVFIRNRFEKAAVKELLNLKWWDLPDEIIIKKIDFFYDYDINKFIKKMKDEN